jgi:hypothetical protein
MRECVRQVVEDARALAQRGNWQRQIPLPPSESVRSRAGVFRLELDNVSHRVSDTDKTTSRAIALDNLTSRCLASASAPSVCPART